MTSDMDNAPIAFLTDDDPAAVRINFGIFAGRQATPAEIDALAQELVPLVGGVSIVAEERHEIDEFSEAAVASVRVELEEPVPADLAAQLVGRCELWARSCISDRRVEITEV